MDPGSHILIRPNQGLIKVTICGRIKRSILAACYIYSKEYYEPLKW